jgi:hypothetical protein
MRRNRRRMAGVLAALAFAAGAGAAEYSWEQPHAKVLPTGDLEWAPEPFAFEKGESPRYIDFDGGDDGNDGLTRETAWKHHPLDPAAQGAAKAGAGPHTYVFRRGVVYRGSLRGRLEGRESEPVFLTSDPAWGTGEAVIAGSERIANWTRGAGRADMPDADRVWRAELDFAPRSVWLVRGPDVTRLALARTPNWTVSDPQDVMSEWWTWEQPEWWTDKNKTEVGGTKMHLGIDRRHLTGRPGDYEGGLVWSEWGIVMGTPFPALIERFDPATKGIAFQGFWYNDSGKIITGNRYFLEDKPNFLDAPGEFWFDRRGEGGVLYVRLPGDADPNAAQVEAARRINLVDLEVARHVRIRGLTFRFANVYWDLTARGFVHRDVESAAIRLLGSGDDIRVDHCRFEYVNKAVRLKAQGDADRLDRVVVADNDVRFTDHGAIEIEDSSRWAKNDPPFGELGDVRVFRNRLHEIGRRPFRSDSAHAVCVNFAETLEVAGNMLDRTYGSGLFIFTGKGSGQTRDRPLARTLIHHNKAVQTLLAANDWGGIETWQGGPTYVFDNISGDPNGYWNWHYNPKEANTARLGYAYYLDGSFKNYHFNNIAWGASNDLTSPRCNNTAFYHAVPTVLNAFVNNTVYRFADGSAWSPAGGRQLYLGNLWIDIRRRVFAHGKQKEDQGAVYDHYPLETVGYARNVFHGLGGSLGSLEGSGSGDTDLAGFQAAAAARKLLASEVGVLADAPPVRDAAAHDFRPVAGGAAADRGAKMFVPWGLARMVGEWNFRRDNADPAVAIDEHWYMSPGVVGREKYRELPRFDLRGVNVRAEDYVEGPLENWTAGAVRLNGRDQHFALAAAAPLAGLPGPHDAAASILVEIHFRTAPGHAGGALVNDLGERGYELSVTAGGALAFLVRADGEACATSPAPVNDGRWHHAIAERDGASNAVRLYVDGRLAAEASAAPGGSLRNAADLLVGARPDGAHFAGEVEFLRIALGTLADAKTTIEELYAWEFDGPFLRDFTGARRPEGAWTAGALEAAP